MQNVSIQKASELPQVVKSAVEQLLGSFGGVSGTGYETPTCQPLSHWRLRTLKRMEFRHRLIAVVEHQADSLHNDIVNHEVN